ncbi:MAG: ATP-binding protein [Gemmatimonadetes bacterium]|nr:ATP-binding protein [Gemmatimonadota bacterium]
MSALPRILELAEITGRHREPGFRALMRRLAMYPDPRLEESLLRKLTAEAGDEAYSPQPFKTPTSRDFIVPGAEHVPYLGFGTAVKPTVQGLEACGEMSVPHVTVHRLFVGATRGGKSMAARRLVDGQLCFIIDPEDDPAYADLALSGGWQVIDWQNLRIGLFGPPAGVPDEVWWGYAIRNMGESLYLRDGSKSMLRFLLKHCKGLNPSRPVSIADLYEALMQLRFKLQRAGREYGFYESLKNRFEGLLTSPVFSCASGHDIADLTSTSTLLRFRGMNADDYCLAVNDLLLRISCHFQPDPHPVPKLMLVVEELHRLTNRERLRRADIAEPVVLDAARTLAKCRVALLCTDQVPSELPTQIVANCTSRFVFSTIEGRDQDAIQRSLSLNHEQRAALSRLPRQVCVVQYNNPSWPEPFLVRVHDCPVRAPEPAEIEKRIHDTINSLSFIPLEGGRPAAAEPPKEEKLPLVSKGALDYLVEISKDQLVPVTWRDRRLQVPLSQGTALRSELASSDLIELQEVRTHNKSRGFKLTVVTNKGVQFLKSIGVACQRPAGRGSLEHIYHQHVIAAWARRNGYHATVEHFVDGKSVDVSLQKDGVAIAAEVLIEGVQKEIANLRDLEVGFNQVWYCVKSEDEAAKLKRTITATLGPEAAVVLEKVRFKLLREFQPEFDEGGPQDRPEASA